ncbi:hypothetical protein M3Y97_00363100 [Aphelenchoides bicaudatus]|nr:hypothetical protein M3Y97_00363100 [Aphelenchoides bicaudatus]
MAGMLLALKKAAILDLKNGNLDKAVEKLQKLVRISNVAGLSEATSTVPLWLILGETYKQKFNYLSAVRVFLSVLEIEPNVSARLQLIELYRVIGQLDNSVEVARTLEKEGNCPENLKAFFLINYAYSLVLYAQSVQSIEEQKPLFEELFPLLINLTNDEHSLILQKTLAIALEIVQSADSDEFPGLCQTLNLPALGINNRLELIEKRVAALKIILEGNLTFSDSWNDLAICLSELATLNGDETMMDKAEKFMERAILLPSSAQKRSNYYFNLGALKSKRLRLSSAAHFFIRALQLNDQNAKAWYALSLIYKKVDKIKESHEARLKAQQIDPDVVEMA